MNQAQKKPLEKIFRLKHSPEENVSVFWNLHWHWIDTVREINDAKAQISGYGSFLSRLLLS